MENVSAIEQDDTFKVFIAVGIIFSALSGIITLIKFLEEKEIARKKLAKARKL